MEIAEHTTHYGMQIDLNKSFKATAKDASLFRYLWNFFYNACEKFSHFWKSVVDTSTVIETMPLKH